MLSMKPVNCRFNICCRSPKNRILAGGWDVWAGWPGGPARPGSGVMVRVRGRWVKGVTPELAFHKWGQADLQHVSSVQILS